MVKETSSWFDVSDGAKLYSKTWIPDEAPRCHLVFVHGFSDRCEMQRALFPTLASSPFLIQSHSFDQRGWGKSVLEKSHTGNSGPTSQVLKDIHEFVKYVAGSIPDIKATPLFLMGHSMGGQETLHYMLSKDTALLDDRPKISGYVVAAPYIALDPSSEPSALLVITGKLAAKVMPKFQLKQVLDHKYITRDPVYNEEWKDDKLCHDTGTLEGLRDMLQRSSDLNQISIGAGVLPQQLQLQLPVPTLWLHGTADYVTAFAPSKALFEKLTGPDVSVVPEGVQGKTFKAYEGAYHKLQCEPDGFGEEFSRDIATWVVSVADAVKGTKVNELERARL